MTGHVATLRRTVMAAANANTNEQIARKRSADALDAVHSHGGDFAKVRKTWQIDEGGALRFRSAKTRAWRQESTKATREVDLGDDTVGTVGILVSQVCGCCFTLYLVSARARDPSRETPCAG